MTTVQLFYGLLALVAWAIIGGLLAVRPGAAGSASMRERWDALATALAPNALGLAWFVALLATAGSLYFSDVAGYEPCRLCWYQRIAMYPILVILAVGAARRERAGAVYASALALVGAVIAGYHVALEWVPALDTGACSASIPCTLIWFRVFGFISLPTLSLTAFVLILTLLVIHIRTPADRSEP